MELVVVQYNLVPKIRFLKFPDKMSEQVQNVQTLWNFALTEIILSLSKQINFWSDDCQKCCIIMVVLLIQLR